MKIVLTVLGVLIAVIAALGIIAPADFQIEREIVINKPKSLVFNDIKMVQNHQSWNPWAKRDPNIRNVYVGTDGTVGFIAAWSGNSEVGEGEQEIKKIVDGERIDFELRFTKPFQSTSQAYLITESAGDAATKVKWGMIGKNRFPFSVICFVFNMKATLQKDFDSGLEMMKSSIEQK